MHTFVGLGRQNESEAASGRSRTEPQAEHRESESEDPTVQPVCLQEWDGCLQHAPEIASRSTSQQGRPYLTRRGLTPTQTPPSFCHAPAPHGSHVPSPGASLHAAEQGRACTELRIRQIPRVPELREEQILSLHLTIGGCKAWITWQWTLLQLLTRAAACSRQSPAVLFVYLLQEKYDLGASFTIGPHSWLRGVVLSDTVCGRVFGSLDRNCGVFFVCVLFFFSSTEMQALHIEVYLPLCPRVYPDEMGRLGSPASGDEFRPPPTLQMGEGGESQYNQGKLTT